MKKEKKLEKNNTETETTKGSSRGKNIASYVFIALIFIIGFSVLLYPTFSDWWNQRRNASLIVEYEEAMAHIDDTSYVEMMAAAKAYNIQHTYNTFTDVFEGEEYILHHPYDQLLDPAGNGTMGYIDVPKISQRLAIGHGTGNAVLEQGVGHVEGSSLPIGGEGTHSVLAGHRGLPNAKIFSDADQLVEGDKFFLYILDEILAYEIDQIEIVEPDDDTFLQIEDGQDLVTLLTCTPYGVNSHRMLIRGHRIPYDPEDIVTQSRQRKIPDRDKPALIAGIGVGVLFLILIIGRLIIGAKDRKRKEEEDRQLIKDATETAKRAAEEAGKAAKAAEEAKNAAIAARDATTRDAADQAVNQAVESSSEARGHAESARDMADTVVDAEARTSDTKIDGDK